MIYQATPENINPEWVTIGDTLVRLKRMETKSVEVSILVPQDIKIKEGKWYFSVNADGASISKYTQESIVTTVENDTVLELKLQKTPLQKSVDAIKNIESSLSGDKLVITNYNPETNILTIDGFKPSSERHIFVTYEYPGMITTAYNQLWLLTML
jgi:hypothetical protein